jgi:hypothetical protein
LNAFQPRTPVSIQGRSVSTLEQANLAPTATLDATKRSDPIDFVSAPEHHSDAVDFRRPPLHLQLSQLKRIHALCTVSGEGDSASMSTSTVAALADAYTDADLFETIRQIRGDELDGAGSLHLFHGEATFHEQAPGSFTRHKLKQLATSWDLWLASEWTQLDARQQQSIFGVPCPAPPGATVLRSYRNYDSKPFGARNTPMFSDGSKRTAPELRFAQMHDSCVDEPWMRLFFAWSTAIGFVVME